MAFPNGKFHCVMESMTTTLTLDKAGRVVLPKPVRDEMQLRAGDSLELESSEDRMVLGPRRRGVGLDKKQGIWVFSTGSRFRLNPQMKRCAKCAANANLVFWAILLRPRRAGKKPGEMVLRQLRFAAGAAARS
jgi:AbrB family looped-hinge helix DNA binding protein